MSGSETGPEGSRRGRRSLPPRDAATLILVRRDGRDHRVLLGQRHPDHKFMPGKFVFPGGRLDREDGRVPVASDMEPETLRRLMLRVHGKPNPHRARALALAAIRETFEEVGLMVGEPCRLPVTVPGGWRAFFATGHAPALAGLRFFARAITPPRRIRRFDTRFFVADARCVVNLDRPLPTSVDELRIPGWFTFEEAGRLELASITRDILDRLAIACVGGGSPDLAAPVSFQFMRAKRWQLELL